MRKTKINVFATHMLTNGIFPQFSQYSKTKTKNRKQSIPCDENDFLDFIKTDIWNPGEHLELNTALSIEGSCLNFLYLTI